MDQRPKCKSQNHNTPRRKHRSKRVTLDWVNFLNMTPKAQAAKDKNR